MLAAPPDVLRWSPRSAGHGDCTIAAIELACGVTYEQALAAAVQVDPNVLDRGLHGTEIVRTVQLLGFAGELRRTYNLEEDTGMLFVQERGGRRVHHVVYLWEGRILEPRDDRRQLWLSAEQFLKHYRYKAYGLIVVKEDKS